MFLAMQPVRGGARIGTHLTLSAVRAAFSEKGRRLCPENHLGSESRRIDAGCPLLLSLPASPRAAVSREFCLLTQVNVDLPEGPGSQAAHSLGSGGGLAQQEPGSSPFRLLSAFPLPPISPQSVPAK